MKKFMMMLIFVTVSTLLLGLTYTQTVSITNSTADQTITFDYYDEGWNLNKVTVILYSTATNGELEADNDHDTESSVVTLHLGADFNLTDNATAPRLLNNDFLNVWNDDTESTKDTTLTANVGSEGGAGHPIVDSSPPDGTILDGIDQANTVNDSIQSSFISGYEGTGTFTFTLQKDAINSIDQTGGSVDGAWSNVDLGGYVRIIYEDDNPVPVELSTFTALQTTQSFAKLTWVTYSETNMAGYNIYRSESEQYASAYTINSDIIPSENSISTYEYEFIDTEVEFETTYYYWLEAVNYDGGTEKFGPTQLTLESPDNPSPPEIEENLTTGIQNIFPNPFNPATTVDYYLNDDGNVTIEIYNIKGRKIYQFDEGYKNADVMHSIQWNGLDSNANPVASGLYFFKFKSGNWANIKKAILMK